MRPEFLRSSKAQPGSPAAQRDRQRHPAGSKPNGPAGTRAFGESMIRRLQRYALATAYLAMPKRIATLPALIGAVAVSSLRGGVEQPADADVASRPSGFAGVIAKPTPQSLLAAHRHGFFPHSHMGPLKWWTREKRFVQFLAERGISKTLRYEMRKAPLVVTFDQAFDTVIRACAQQRPGRPRLTWITPDIMRLYARMHALGDAHSFEVWNENGDLVGGGYGVAVGRVFVTESLFSRTGSASKMGLQSLNYHLGLWGFVLNDVKDYAPHLDIPGARHVTRKEYAALLAEHAGADVQLPPQARPWVSQATLAEIVVASNKGLVKAKTEPKLGGAGVQLASALSLEVTPR